MPDINDYHAFKSTSGGSDSGGSGDHGGRGFGCGCLFNSSSSMTCFLIDLPTR